MKRYERLASQISDLIRRGDLPPGTRIPTVRAACDAYGVSPSTVFRAYYLLESQGLIVARPRSGYFVSAAASGAPLHGEASPPAEPSKSVNISELVFEVLHSIKDTHTVALGSAFMSPTVFPMQRLGRSCASVNRSTDLAKMVAALPPGDDALRRQIALRYLMAGMVVHVDEIIITSGALDALTLSLQVLTPAGDPAASTEGCRDSCSPCGRSRHGGAHASARPSSDPRLLVHDLVSEPDRGEALRHEKAGAGRIAREVRSTAYRRRRVQRAAFWIGADTPGEIFRPAGTRAALWIVREEPRTRLPNRLGSGGTIRGTARAREVDDDAIGQRPGATRDSRLPRAWRLRPLPAQSSPRSRGSAGGHAARHRPIFSRANHCDAARRRLLDVGRAAAPRRFATPVRSGARAGDQLRARADVFSQR